MSYKTFEIGGREDTRMLLVYVIDSSYIIIQCSRWIQCRMTS